MPENNVNIVRRLFEEFWNDKTIKVADEIISPDCRIYDPNGPDHGTGPNAYKKHASTYITAFPDSHLRMDDVVDGGDKVVVRWTATGTHKGDLRGIPPTNQRVEVTGMSAFRCTNGKINEEWLQWDALGLMRQLGALPVEEQPRRAA
jgi:steroid delta-isomerase-like uncharacterized protein